MGLLICIEINENGSLKADEEKKKKNCKFFYEAAEDNYIFQRLSLDQVPVVPWLTSKEISCFLERCKESENPEALYRQGVVDYFSSTSPNPESGLESLKKAANLRHNGALYVLAVVLLSRGDEFKRQGVELFREIKKSKETGRLFRDCREELWAIVRTIWVRNPLDRQWRPGCCTEQDEEHRRRRPGWESGDGDDDNVRCHACRCDIELACVMDMFSCI